MGKLFVAYKPYSISSNKFLISLKKQLDIKKAGYSGTLDPLAQGTLIIATKKYTKLFNFLKKEPKVYKTTLWLGAKSKTLDTELIDEIKIIEKISTNRIKSVLKDMLGEIIYTPPIFSSKKVNGKRSYSLARKDIKPNLKSIKSIIYNIDLIEYSHPFLTLKVAISQGGYIRSIGDIIARKLGTEAIISYLERIKEGDFVYDNQKCLNILDYLNIEENFYTGYKQNILHGKKIEISDLKIKNSGTYFLKIYNKITIIRLVKPEVNYLVNGIEI